MVAMGDDVGAGTVSRPDHWLRQPHDRREPCLFHIHTNQTKPHYAEAVGSMVCQQLAPSHYNRPSLPERYRVADDLRRPLAEVVAVAEQEAITVPAHRR
jgi:hypothetical protein